MGCSKVQEKTSNSPGRYSASLLEVTADKGKGFYKDGFIHHDRKMKQTVIGTYVHGIFDNQVFRRTILDLAAEMFDIKLESKAKAGRGYLFIVIDPSVFIDINKFKQNVSDRIAEIKAGRKAEGIGEIFIPGEKSQRTKEENLKNGYIEVEDKVIEELKELSK